MAELRPFPFGALVTRALRELGEQDTIFDLPRAKFFTGAEGLDLGVRFHGRRAGTPFGPAAGPQSQMAHNLALSWLAGGRIVELKTVQVDDQLRIPRPCIDMQTVGYNVEWSQELTLEQSLEEYVKGAMLVRILEEEADLGLDPGLADLVWDMSVGYDLAGIGGERVQAFIDGMLDCRGVVDRLRPQIPERWRHLRDLDFGGRLSDTLTLSTFHGCPPGEIERIVDYLLREKRLSAVVKLNPMLLGPDDTRALLNDALGYRDVLVPDSAFERDTRWDQALAFCERLGATARELELGFGIKLTNTLIVRNHRDFFPESEREMYLSGAPLHVLAMELVRRFRATCGDRWPISFSAGIDRKNFPDAVALGLVPITVCSDLLRPGGYARGRGYLDELAARMRAVGATDVETFVLAAYGEARAALAQVTAADDGRRAACERALDAGSDPRAAAGEELTARWLAAVRLENTERYVAGLPGDPRYGAERNSKPPRKIGSRLELFDCIACDKCVPVCPNDANFSFELPPLTVPIVHVRPDGAGWAVRSDGELRIEAQRQYANFADFCNDCGNCDVFCPEDGGPYVVKPRFFGSLADWRDFRHLDGFHLEQTDGADRIRGRCGGREYELEVQGRRSVYRGEDFELAFDSEDPLATLTGSAAGEVDLTWARVLGWMRDAVYASGAPTWPALAAERP